MEIVKRCVFVRKGSWSTFGKWGDGYRAHLQRKYFACQPPNGMGWVYGKSKWFLLFYTFAFFKLKTLIPHYHHCSIYILINVLTSGLVFSYASSSTLYTGHSHGRWVLRWAQFQNNIVLRLASLLLLLLIWLIMVLMHNGSSTLYPYV